MEVNRKRAKAIILPITEKAEKCIMSRHNKLSYQPEYLTQEWLRYNDATSHHLYFITDDKIEKGDWYLVMPENQVKQAIIDFFGKTRDAKKIVATTDKSLGLPQPSEAFIKKYCELGGINEVDIEYQPYTDHEMITFIDWDKYRGHEGREEQLKEFDRIEKIKNQGEIKVDSHNTITIYPIKDSWNREEVESLIQKFRIFVATSDKHDLPSCNKWIEENL